MSYARLKLKVKGAIKTAYLVLLFLLMADLIANR